MPPIIRRLPHQISPSLPLGVLRRTLASSISAASGDSSPPVAVFWDLDNIPSNSIRPLDAAVRLRLAASSIGPLRFVVAYASPHVFRHVPYPVRAAREAGNDRLEDSGAVPASSEPYVCRVCGRKFFAHSKLLNHFKIHEQEHAKRLRRLDSLVGSRYVRLKAQLTMKMEKYRKAARDILIPRVGYSLGDELCRAGVVVRTVEDRPEAADGALRRHMVETMDRGKIGCLVLVSDDTGFVGVIREARLRCLKTVVIGDEGDGGLKRCADASFSWKDVISGKARKEAASAMVKWKDKDLLTKLEWRYREEKMLKGSKLEGSECDDLGYQTDDVDGFQESDNGDNGAYEPWWKLDEESDTSVARR
ncbi:hypothetical protein AXF42_Ash012460 [Apostasia shenzhenica]|uniref:C2H2-type domain-containing protein n=1 Tax=Apostasia shenzhenica TaxID=1088818 RepID=A0A2I0AQT7_9ASPA|nr:hypothetical protein AXF42_Ash012460 [Apostasia shenzhenica]